MLPDFLYGVTDGDYDYDIESYPNVWTIGLRHHVTKQQWYFEISDRRNDLQRFCLFIETCQRFNARWVGYNNIGYDYPVVHYIYRTRDSGVDASYIYEKSMSIINASHASRFANTIWEDDWLIPQLDLYKIHHFDNMARATSLKILEFNMRMNSIEDLPFTVGTELDFDQTQVLADYMWHDIDATSDFHDETLKKIEFREVLTKKYNRSFINHNDTKIGKDYFIMMLEQSGIPCKERRDGKMKVRQTVRETVPLADVILPYIYFEHPEFNRILEYFKTVTLTKVEVEDIKKGESNGVQTKGVFKDINCIIDGFKFVFGAGGVHGSVDSQTVYSDDYWVIEDWDVASYYPNLAIVNRLYPAHLGPEFCDIYLTMYQDRLRYGKKSDEGAMLKLGLNGVYGDSNNKYSPFYDTQYTMAITINGQLSLCMMAEQLIKLADLTMIQINTDGLTVRYPRHYKEWVHNVAKWWEQVTGLELESVEYNRMFIRDVNNYIGEYTDGEAKLKGAYAHDLEWHQNHSSIIVAKAAEAALVHGTDIREYITGALDVNDIFDFFLRAKVPRSNRLLYGGEQVSNIVRYYISTGGDVLEKIMPAAGPIGEYKRANKLTDVFFNGVLDEIGPGVWDERIHTKNMSVYDERKSGINSGWKVQLCNDVELHQVSHGFNDINYEWYIKEAEKLVRPLTDV